MQMISKNILLQGKHSFTVGICRYENLESLGKCFVTFVRMHLPSAFKGNTYLEIQ